MSLSPKVLWVSSDTCLRRVSRPRTAKMASMDLALAVFRAQLPASSASLRPSEDFFLRLSICGIGSRGQKLASKNHEYLVFSHAKCTLAMLRSCESKSTLRLVEPRRWATVKPIGGKSWSHRRRSSFKFARAAGCQSFPAARADSISEIRATISSRDIGTTPQENGAIAVETFDGFMPTWRMRSSGAARADSAWPRLPGHAMNSCGRGQVTESPITVQPSA